MWSDTTVYRQQNTFSVAKIAVILPLECVLQSNSVTENNTFKLGISENAFCYKQNGPYAFPIFFNRL